MKLTPAQFRDALGVSQETLRHWRKVLPIFQGRSGYTPVFTTGDLVAGAVIKTVREHLGIAVNTFAELSVSLGDVCNNTPWAKMPTGAILVSLSDKKCSFISLKKQRAPTDLLLIVPLAPIIDHLTKALLQDRADVQRPILFPPTEVAGAGRKAKSA